MTQTSWLSTPFQARLFVSHYQRWALLHLRHGHVHDADPQIIAMFRRRARDNSTSSGAQPLEIAQVDLALRDVVVASAACKQLLCR